MEDCEDGVEEGENIIIRLRLPGVAPWRCRSSSSRKSRLWMYGLTLDS